MALFINFTYRQQPNMPAELYRGNEWHRGEEFQPPLPQGVRTMSFQADGEELQIILRALRATRRIPTDADYL